MIIFIKILLVPEILTYSRATHLLGITHSQLCGGRHLLSFWMREISGKSIFTSPIWKHPNQTHTHTHIYCAQRTNTPAAHSLTPYITICPPKGDTLLSPPGPCSPARLLLVTYHATGTQPVTPLEPESQSHTHTDIPGQTPENSSFFQLFHKPLVTFLLPYFPHMFSLHNLVGPTTHSPSGSFHLFRSINYY